LTHWSVIVRKFRRLPAVVLGTALLALGISPAATPALASAQSAAPTATTTLTGTFKDGATFKIEVPGNWNGTLFLYSHGYVVPGTPNPAADVGDPVTGAWLLSHGYALAGSSYSTTGWAIQQALPDQIHTLNVFDKRFGRPAQTIAWGHSLGGIITAGLIQTYPRRFDAALPMCGVLAGGVATWNTALDAEFAFQQLIAGPAGVALQLVNITSPTSNLTAADTVLQKAQTDSTGKSQARLALVAALGDTPGWFQSLSPEPAQNDFTAQEVNQFNWDLNVTFPFVFALRAELEARAGGNVSWNTGVNYFRDLKKSADFREVRGLYKAAGLNLRADLTTLNRATRISADPSAVRYLAQNITFDGRLSVPVLTMHTTGDGLVVSQNEQAYRSVVRRAGESALLREIFVHRAGHCAFTPAETITAAQTLLRRLATGHWSHRALQPADLNTAAAGLGPAYNIFPAQGGKCPVGSPISGVCPTAPAFLGFRPTRYLRPFDRLMFDTHR
jgi:pimeloyl-ACP methyl ester carboxylesterase